MNQPKYQIGDRIPQSPFTLRGIALQNSGKYLYFVQVDGSNNCFVATLDDLAQSFAITRLRELFHEKEQLQKLRSGLISQLRQRLSLEFSEAARHTMKISQVKGYTPIIYWLAFNHFNSRYEKKYNDSIAPKLGIFITDFTRAHAKTIIDLEHRITETGDKSSRKFHGNSIIRSHLYMRACCTVTRKIKRHELRKELSDRYAVLRTSVKGKDAITRILFKLTRMLFYELVKETRIG
ncbi:MAG: hypothetical protein HC764_10710 [Pleurocapsa sp. CRU_1_2]|nr:hypothetical protein [Pleurocapsa sp. CRU_1_2]